MAKRASKQTITGPFHPDYKHVGNEPENIEDMPYKTKTQCNYPRCSVSVEHGKRYCPKHIKDKPGNEIQSHPWYHKASYRRNRKRYVLDNPECNECGKLIQKVSDRHLDHIRPWKTGSNKFEQWELFSNEDNWQTLCPSCHSRKTKRENG